MLCRLGTWSHVSCSMKNTLLLRSCRFAMTMHTHFGSIGDHNVMIACLPQGRYGLTSTASVMKNTVRTFPVRFGVMVSIGGGAPSWKHDIRLGDVVASSPKSRTGGVV